MSFGRPLMIVTRDETVRLPEPIDDSRLGEKMGEWNTQPRDHPSLLESYIQSIKLYDILKQVLDREELKDSSDICPDIRSLLSLDTMIMEWRDALPSYLQYDTSSDESGLPETRTPEGILIPQVDFSAQASSYSPSSVRTPLSETTTWPVKDYQALDGGKGRGFDAVRHSHSMCPFGAWLSETAQFPDSIKKPGCLVV
jgi:hypothetical protein